ncbi:hypothetical protein QYR02_16855 [Microbacterium maritypicum]|uniref:hypothetical protein n=1 Tax=Microbacterium maritypicum TaxID=33918 RepID=UPI0026738645|nr:hypothetical protein [Microbacterium liquefaciens]WKT89084.1 hypothetical protein QYR02_16855 [Microbacterium liquefaciens]
MFGSHRASVPGFSADRIKHLEFLQATIARQAAHSFAVKGWSLTVAAALFAYTATHLEWWLSLIALVPPVVFAGLDAFYLRQERLFRQLYNAVAVPRSSVAMFSMDVFEYTDPEKYPSCRLRGRTGVWRSKSWLQFHAMIIGVGAVLLGVAIFQAFSTTELAQCISDLF